MEANVFEHHHVAVLKLLSQGMGGRADDVFRQRHLSSAEQLGQAGGHGLEGDTSGLNSPLGRPR